MTVTIAKGSSRPGLKAWFAYWNAGCEASRLTKPSNPYPKGSEEHYHWNSGLQYARHMQLRKKG